MAQHTDQSGLMLLLNTRPRAHENIKVHFNIYRPLVDIAGKHCFTQSRETKSVHWLLIPRLGKGHPTKTDNILHGFAQSVDGMGSKF